MRCLLASKRLWWYAMAVGGGTLVLSGCDPAVRELVLTGVSNATTGLASTFIGAFFQSLIQQDDGTTTTVRAVIEQARLLFA